MAIVFLFSLPATSYEDIVRAYDVLRTFVDCEMPGYQIFKIPKDGLCILSAFRENMKRVEKVDLMRDDLKTTLTNEISNKIDNYKVFVEKEVNISEELESYIQHPLKAYGTKTSDLFLIALANSYRVIIKIVHSNTIEVWVSNCTDINPTSHVVLYFAR